MKTMLFCIIVHLSKDHAENPTFFNLHLIFGTELEYYLSNVTAMEVIKKGSKEGEEKEWEDPFNPTKPSDPRDKEQIERQYKEAKRRKSNLTEKDHIDKKQSK